jgi:tetratricopeptide (TPR) repeat protein
LLVGGAGGWVVLERNRALATCELDGSAITSVWNDDVREAARAGLLAASPEFGPRTADLAEPRLDVFADAWAAARTHACVASTIDETLDPPLAANAIACLDEGRARFEALVGTLPHISTVGVWGVVGTTADLPPPARCVDERWLRLRPPLPEDPQLRERVTQLRLELLGGPSLATQRPTDAVERIAATVEKAEALGWDPLVAAAQLSYGIAVNGAGRPADAEKILFDAYLNALAAGDDIVAADTAAMLTVVVGYFLGRHSEGLMWSRIGETLSKRTGEVDAHVAAHLLSVTGLVHTQRGDYEAALDHHLRARALWEASAGPGHLEVARERTNAGLALGSLGRYAEAIAELEAALETWTAAVGPQHPEVGLILNNLGSVSLERGTLDEAEEFLKRALAVRAVTVGENHPTYGTTLANLGNAAFGRGRHEEALEYYEHAAAVFTRALGEKHTRVGILYAYLASAELELGRIEDAQRHNDRAIEIIEATLGKEHATLAAPFNNMGALAEQRGDDAAAEAAYQRSIELTERTLGADHPELAFSLTALGELWNARQRFESAVGPLERALSIRKRAGMVGPPLSAVQFELARALHGLGRDPQRVRTLAEAARSEAAERQRSEIDAFVAELDR